MALLHITAHRIQRLDPSSTSTTSHRDQCWEKNGPIEECFRELKVSVIKRFTKEYGRFSDNYGDYPLSSWLTHFKEEKISFDSFSKKAIEHFKVEIDKHEVPIDGFLFFAHEKLETDEIIHLFFVQHNSAQFIDGNLDINESFYLDTSNIQLSAKINISDWQSNDSHRVANAITLLRWRGEKEITDAFVNLIGFSDKVDLGAETDIFLKTVSDYTKSLPETEAFQTKKKVVEYCLEQDKSGKPVVIAELATQLNNQDISSTVSKDSGTITKLPDFAEFVAEHKPAHKPELIPDRSKLNQFVRISGRDHKLSMSFSSSCLGDSIVYDPESDSLTIHNLPSGLKSRLTKHLQNKSSESDNKTEA